VSGPDALVSAPPAACLVLVSALSLSDADARSQAAIAEVDAKVREVTTGSVRMEFVGLGSIVSTRPAVFGG
jgi:hypothetical protein